LTDIPNQMLEDSAFDHVGASLHKAGLDPPGEERHVGKWPIPACQLNAYFLY
jgi:hypothetical protein